MHTKLAFFLGRGCLVWIGLNDYLIYLCYGILAGPIDDVVQGSLSPHIIDADEFQQGGVDEAHTHAVPHVHRRQIRNNRQSAPETVRGSEEIQHCCHAFIPVVKSCSKLFRVV